MNEEFTSWTRLMTSLRRSIDMSIVRGEGDVYFRIPQTLNDTEASDKALESGAAVQLSYEVSEKKMFVITGFKEQEEHIGF